MPKLKGSDIERLRSINLLMDGMYSQLAEIYEGLVDMELDECYRSVSRLGKELKKLQESLKDQT